MTTHDRDKVLAAAKEAGIHRLYDGLSYGPSGLRSEQLERFYAIAFEDGRQAEREECAVVCDCYTLDDDRKNDDARRCAKAIRARSTK